MLKIKWQFVSTLVILTLVGLLFGSTPPAAHAAGCTSVMAGVWSDADKWDCGHAPTISDDVVINHSINATGVSAGNLTIGSGGSLNFSSGTFTINGDITIDGQLTTGGNTTVNVKGNWTFNGYFSPGVDSRVIFNGSGASIIGGSKDSAFVNLWNINDTTLTLARAISTHYLFINSGTFNSASYNMLIYKDITMYAGVTFNAGSSQITIDGHWTDTGTFNAGTSLVIFGSNSAVQFIEAGQPFYRLNFYNPHTIYLFSNIGINGPSTWGTSTDCDTPPRLKK